MANTDNATGLAPLDSPQGSVIRTEYDITDDYAVDLFIGDPVIKVAAGTVSRAATTGVILGIAIGFTDPDGVPQNYYPADSSAGWKVQVCDDPSQKFVIQEDSVGAALALADRGMNCNLIIAAGDTTTGLSGTELDSSSAAVTVTHQCKLIDVYGVIGNAVGANAKWIVKINAHQNANGTVGI